MEVRARPRHRTASRRNRFRLVAAILGALLTLGALPFPADATPTSSIGNAVSTMSAAAAVLKSLEVKSSALDPRYLINGIFVDGTPECFRCTLGPAVLAATYGVRTNTPGAVATAVNVFDRAIRDHQSPDGSLNPPAPGEGGPAIQTVLFANELAVTYLTLGDRLDCAHRYAWRKSLTLSADYLIRTKELTWYTNGNINLAKTINMDLTYHVTGESRFKSAANSSYAFTLSPPQDRWKGFGLRYTRPARASDGSDGAAYLAEAGPGGIGYDTNYTMVQSELAATWYMLTRDERALRLTNLLYNQLAPRIRTSDWTIDVGGGTRHPVTGARYGFAVSTLAVLAGQRKRNDLAALATSQLPVLVENHLKNSTLTGPGASYEYGIGLSTTLLAVLDAPQNTLRSVQCAR